MKISIKTELKHASFRSTMFASAAPLLSAFFLSQYSIRSQFKRHKTSTAYRITAFTDGGVNSSFRQMRHYGQVPLAKTPNGEARYRSIDRGQSKMGSDATIDLA